jgi:hypothetical protein
VVRRVDLSQETVELVAGIRLGSMAVAKFAAEHSGSPVEPGEALAECHRFVLTAGERRGQLGASGRPDPKWLPVGDAEWNASHTDEDDPCADCRVRRPLGTRVRP